MKKQNKKIKEPYEPQDTPKPPQIIEPNSGSQRENKIEDKGRNESDKGKAKATSGQKHHLLSDEADIDDETTV